MSRLGLRFRNSGLDLDRKMWQSGHLCSEAEPGPSLLDTPFIV